MWLENIGKHWKNSNWLPIVPNDIPIIIRSPKNPCVIPDDYMNKSQFVGISNLYPNNFPDYNIPISLVFPMIIPSHILL